MTNPSGWHRKVPGPADEQRRRKYEGAEHRAAKRAYRVLVAAGEAHCWRCGALLVPGGWHVGHDDVAVDVLRGPECAGCNRRAAARKGALIANARRKMRPFVRPRR